jgi:hypothetical protein
MAIQMYHKDCLNVYWWANSQIKSKFTHAFSKIAHAVTVTPQYVILIGRMLHDNAAAGLGRWMFQSEVVVFGRKVENL